MTKNIVFTLILLPFLVPSRLIAVETKEVADELACQCGGCGNLILSACINKADCGWSQSEKTQIDQLIIKGYSKERIVALYVDEFGEAVLAAPTKTGFNLTAWAIPFVAIIVGGVLLRGLVVRWKKSTQSSGTGSVAGSSRSKRGEIPDSEYIERVERELDKFE